MFKTCVVTSATGEPQDPMSAMMAAMAAQKMAAPPALGFGKAGASHVTTPRAVKAQVATVTTSLHGWVSNC